MRIVIVVVVIEIIIIVIMSMIKGNLYSLNKYTEKYKVHSPCMYKKKHRHYGTKSKCLQHKVSSPHGIC